MKSNFYSWFLIKTKMVNLTFSLYMYVLKIDLKITNQKEFWGIG